MDMCGRSKDAGLCVSVGRSKRRAVLGYGRRERRRDMRYVGKKAVVFSMAITAALLAVVGAVFAILSREQDKEKILR